MNVVLNAVRQQVIAQYDPDENDLNVHALELDRIDEDEYFSHVIHKDMGNIIRDIREAHRTDATTVDVASPAAEVQKKFQEAMSYESSEQEKKARVFCSQLGIDYDKLTREEFVTLFGIMKKSEHMKSPYSQRGKGNRTHSKGKRKRK